MTARETVTTVVPAKLPHARRTATAPNPAGVAASVAALGVVFGDIGTSPLYTLKACFDFSHAATTPNDVLGIASLLTYALVVVVCIKYVGFIMKVDDDGEGGILALLARLTQARSQHGGMPPAVTPLTIVVIVGAAMLLGDGIITPAISVISAVEGINTVSPAAQPFVVPVSVGVLASLFLLQSRGTDKVGALFGPVMVLWFVAIAASGIVGIAAHPQVLAALDPRRAAGFLLTHGIGGLLVLGGVVLAVTGVEALYADLSHFGRPPIVRAWYVMVFPALLCNYLGQSAHVIVDPSALKNGSFYALTPGWTLYAMLALATCATVIASQALISGAFTLVKQAVALNLAPRVRVTHTSNEREGQVFIPVVNILLAIGCIALVLTFRSSDHLSAAYGLAVSMTMLATSIAYHAVLVRVLGWNQAVAGLVLAGFVVVDGSFVLAGLPKFIDGGYVPIAIAVAVGIIATTWLEGRRCLIAELKSQSTPVAEVARDLHEVHDATATMVFLTSDPEAVPFFAHHQWIRNRAKEERLVLLTFKRQNRPYVHERERVHVDRFGPHFFRVTALVGYMELPRIQPILAACGAAGLHIDDEDTSFFYTDAKIERASRDPLPSWQRELYRFLARNAHPLPDDLEIKAERRIELGVTVGI